MDNEMKRKGRLLGIVMRALEARKKLAKTRFTLIRSVYLCHLRDVFVSDAQLIMPPSRVKKRNTTSIMKNATWLSKKSKVALRTYQFQRVLLRARADKKVVAVCMVNTLCNLSNRQTNKPIKSLSRPMGQTLLVVDSLHVTISLNSFCSTCGVKYHKSIQPRSKPWSSYLSLNIGKLDISGNLRFKHKQGAGNLTEQICNETNFVLSRTMAPLNFIKTKTNNEDTCFTKLDVSILDYKTLHPHVKPSMCNVNINIKFEKQRYQNQLLYHKGESLRDKLYCKSPIINSTSSVFQISEFVNSFEMKSLHQVLPRNHINTLSLKKQIVKQKFSSIDHDKSKKAERLTLSKIDVLKQSLRHHFDKLYSSKGAINFAQYFDVSLQQLEHHDIRTIFAKVGLLLEIEVSIKFMFIFRK